MRKGIDGLATLIQDSFELDPYGDSIFLFAGWNKDRYKSKAAMESLISLLMRAKKP